MHTACGDRCDEWLSVPCGGGRYRGAVVGFGWAQPPLGNSDDVVAKTGESSPCAGPLLTALGLAADRDAFAELDFRLAFRKIAERVKQASAHTAVVWMESALDRAYCCL